MKNAGRKLRQFVALALLACIGLGGAEIGCYDDAASAGPSTAVSLRRYPTTPPGQTTMGPSPQDMPGGGRGYSDFTKGQKGKP